MLFVMIKQPDHAQDKRQCIQLIVSLVVFTNRIRQFALVAFPQIVPKSNTGNSIAISYIARASTLYIVLLAAKVPKEVADVHKVILVSKIELQIVPEIRIPFKATIVAFTNP